MNPSDAGLRLDQVIAARAPGVSRTLAKRTLALGGVFLDRKRVKVAGRIVHAGQTVEVNLIESDGTRIDKIVRVEIPIVSLTDDYIVVDKPSGVLSAPTPETDQNDLLAFLTHRLQEDVPTAATLHLVHRLDRPTSGLMVVARTREAARSLSEQVSERAMNRTYRAILAGRLSGETRVEEPIDDKASTTIFRADESKSSATLVTATLLTGRTHQVRIHATHLRAPVAGDSKYGRPLQRSLPVRPPRLALHACELSFTDPKTNKVVRFESPLPGELARWFSALPE